MNKSIEYAVITVTTYQVIRVTKEDGTEKREIIGSFYESPLAEEWKTRMETNPPPGHPAAMHEEHGSAATKKK